MKITYKETPALSGGYLYLGEADIVGWDKVTKNALALSKIDKDSRERLNKIMEKFGTKEGDGWKMKDGAPDFGKNKDAANKAAESLMNEEVEVKLLILTSNDLKDGEGKVVALKGNALKALYEKELIV